VSRAGRRRAAPFFVAWHASVRERGLALGAGTINATFQYYTAGGVSIKPPFALQSIRVTGAGGDLLNLGDYEYQQDGNLRKVNGTIGVDYPIDVDLAYVYNSLDWLSHVDATIGGVVYDDWDYGYDDATGRLTDKAGWTLDYSAYHPTSVSQPVHAPGRLADGAILYGYDANGNRIIRQETGVGSTHYVYDAENRLAQVARSTDGSSVLTTTFVYDGDGRRVARIAPVGDPYYPDGAETRYVGAHYEATTARAWSRNETIYGDTGRWQMYPNMTYTADGTLYLVWVESDGHGGAQVRFARRDPAGGWRPSELVGKACADEYGWVRPEARPAVAVDRSGYVTVAWVGCEEDPESTCALYTRSRHPGGYWHVPILVSEEETDYIWPALAATPGGAVYVAWESNDSYYGRNVHVACRGWSGGWTPDYQAGGELPTLAADSRGNVYLAYYGGYYDEYGVFHRGYRLLRRTGGWAEIAFYGYYPGDDFPPALAVDSRGDVHMVLGAHYGVDLVVDGRDRLYRITGDPADIGWGHLEIRVDDGFDGNDDNIVDEDVWNSRYSTIAVGPDDMLVAVWDGVWRDVGGDEWHEDDRRLFVSYFEPHVATTSYYHAEGRQIAARVADDFDHDDLTYILSDHLGSTTVVADALGVEVGHVIYDPYGGILENTLPLTTTGRLFTGQRWDDTIGLYDYGARFYDPETGTFIQPDSIVPQPGNPMAWNRFAYVYNNPVNNVDPSGHDPVLALGIALSAIDTAWDAIDLYTDLRDCLGDSDSMACYMAAAGVGFILMGALEGPSNNVAREAARAADALDDVEDVARRADDVVETTSDAPASVRRNSAGRLIDSRTGRYVPDPTTGSRTAGALHRNHLDTPGPHDVYVIRDADTRRIYHFGETGRGFEVRGQEWVRKLRNEYGLDTYVERLRTVEGKRAARALETRYITTYERIFGFRPGYVDDTGRFIRIQKTIH
jgi:RHS repeat-associated protein